jgi:hypothetical protein
MTNGLTFRALGALPAPLQTLARAHARQHPSDSLDDLISELSLAALELADRTTDAACIYNRARSRLRRATQDPAHYVVGIDIERHDVEIEQDDEPSSPRRADITREVAQRQRVSLRRAQQLVRRQVERARLGDLFAGAGGEKS